MVYSKTIQGVIAGLLAIAFLFVHAIPDDILYIIDNLVIRFILIVALIGSIYFSPLVSILAFLLITRIFLERNNLKIHQAKAFINTSDAPLEPVIESTGDIINDQAPVDRTVHSDSYDELSYIPNEEIGSDEFEWSGSSGVGNFKQHLQGVTEGEQAANSVFADVRPENSTNAV